MLYKNIVSGESTHNRGLALLWLSRGESIDIYKFNGKGWTLVGGWIA